MALELDILDNASYQIPNWAEKLDEQSLVDLGKKVCDAKDVDLASRDGWMAETDLWLDMAQQVIEKKNTPWPNASAIKYPLLAQSALSFHARAHQELLKGERLVKGKVIGKDKDGEKAARARRIETAMSNQLLYQMEDWQDDTDRLLYVLPLVGTVFRKAYWSDLLKKPATELVLASSMVVNYYASDWSRARKTHILGKDKNEMLEQNRLGNYLDVDLPQAPEPTEQDEDGISDDGENVSLPEDVPYVLLEQHGWYDLDDDGYEEPYIVTVEQSTQQVLRIIPRYNPDRVEMLGDEILRITPIEYVVVYKFLPDVESSIYGVGLGKLLGPSNAAIDTIINQMIDTGTLNTMPSGFVGRGVRLSRGGRIRLQPGQWESVNSTGEDLQRNFFAMPTKDPSPVLLQLLGMLIQSGEKLGSTTEALSGENPGQNQPFSTTSAVMEQGLQVFLGIYKRVYRSMTAEFRMIGQLNHMFLSEDEYNDILDLEEMHDPVADFNPDGLDIVPEADPSLANSMRKQRRVQALIEGQRSGMPLNQEYIAKMFLEAIDEPEPELALKMQPPPPSKQQIDKEMFEQEHKLAVAKFEWDKERQKNDPVLALSKAMEAFAKAKALGSEGEMQQMEHALKIMVERTKAQGAETKMIGDIAMQAADLNDKQAQREHDAKQNTDKPGTGRSS